MGRIRTIKPEFPQSQSMGRVSREARLLFVLLWTLADDSGRTRAASRMLASLLYPYDDDAPRLISGWLEELATVNAIVLYTVDGDDYLEVRNWLKHQKIDKPSKSKFPPFDESSRALANPREQSTTDQGPRTKDQGPLSTARVPLADRPVDSAARSKSVDRPSDVPEQVWSDWLAHRKRKKAVVNATAIDRTRREADKAGMSLADAMATSIANGWQGFEADWLKARGRAGVGVPEARKMNYVAGTDESNGWEDPK
jgi:hypothetical protein